MTDFQRLLLQKFTIASTNR